MWRTWEQVVRHIRSAVVEVGWRFCHVRFISLTISYKKLEKQIQFGRMLPDNFPVFNIELECDFESSDNVYPTYCPLKQSSAPPKTNNTILVQEQNLFSFSTIGRRNDNLDRAFWLRLPHLLLVALLDGHCDPCPADYLQEHLLKRLSQHSLLQEAPEKAMEEVFGELEEEICSRFEKGCTAMVLLAMGDEVVVANLGDSQLFGIKQGKATALTAAHNLANQQQLMQVINRGGIVLKKGEQYRINGELNLSRAFGDRHLKHCMSSTPDIYRFPKNAYKRWVMATDGFYNAKHNEKRMTMADPSELANDSTVYADNASAIFLHF